MPDWSHDLVLKALQDLEEPVGSLVRAFPGGANVANDTEWLEIWFLDLVQRTVKGQAPNPKKIVASAAKKGELSLLAKPPVESSVRLVCIRPQFFRGFRDTALPTRFEEDLIVVEGRNSSGKTSLSEAIEWVLTGQLSRRTSGEHGHASELAHCIANEFRADGQDTFVELTLTVDDQPVVLKRILRRDYSKTASEQPLSTLFVNGESVMPDDEIELMDKLFAGVHPILMQHNLRRFVHDDPTSRRQYFERLLQIDELTGLIQKAVIGPTRLKQIANPEGGTGLAALRALVSEMEKDSKTSPRASNLKKIEKVKAESVPEALAGALVAIAQECFPTDVAEAKGLTQCRDVLAEAQRVHREARLPLLGGLEKARTQTAPAFDPMHADLETFKLAAEGLDRAKNGAAVLTEAQQELARVTESLLQASLIDPNEASSQVCPVCEDPSATLTAARVKQLASWTPLAKAVDAAEAELRELRGRIKHRILRLRSAAKAVIPPALQTAEVEKQLVGASQRVVALTQTSLKSAGRVRQLVGEILKAISGLADLVQKPDLTGENLDSAIAAVPTSIGALLPTLTLHREHVGHLEEAVGAASRDDATYRLREKWLDVAGLTTGVAEDVAWERSKVTAKASLDGLRDGLIALRTEIIEDARKTLSDGMTKVWHLLRSDSGAQFSRLRVPPPRGKGYKLEFELKAVISDGKSNPEVDALRVFSESQINVIGLAAYITRARLLGHKILIFDDPVQSMDEEHFRSFAAKLLPKLLEEGLQILILTHSDTFARRLHDHHFERESFVTLETRVGKKFGCQVIEGNRRVSERLKNARSKASEGDLQGAWRLIRLAMERLYTLAYAKQNDGFDSETWRNMTAEDMWKQGVGELIEKAVPGSSARLREILTATAAGAHDKPATSETDVSDATKYLVSLLDPLRLGAG